MCDLILIGADMLSCVKVKCKINY